MQKLQKKTIFIAFLITIQTDGLDSKSVPGSCGKSVYHEEHRRSHGVNKRIVGGQQSQAGEWPWLVSMMLKRVGSSEYEHTCGGTLIAPQWVISAAHCFEPVWVDYLNANPENWMVRIGEHNLFDEHSQHEDVVPEKILFHPLRNAPETFNLDIALIKLSRPVNLNVNVNVVCLPDIGEIPEPQTLCVTAGWGYQQEDGNISSIVRHVQVPIVSNKMCNTMYSKLAHLIELEIPRDMTCAGFDFGGHDACQYDSGGPMVCFNRDDDEWVLSGVVSVGFGCARSGFPGIYTLVPIFSEWIKDTMGLE